MPGIDGMIAGTGEQLSTPAAAHHPGPALAVAVEPSLAARRPGRFLALASRNRGCRTPVGLTPAPDDARGRRALHRGGLTTVVRAASQREELGGPDHVLSRSFR